MFASNRQSLKSMMLRTAKNLKVRNIVVMPISIYMMNVFGCFKFSSKKLLHNISMKSNSLTLNLFNLITKRLVSIRMPFGVMISIFLGLCSTRTRACSRKVCNTWNNIKNSFTCSASNFDPFIVWRSFSPLQTIHRFNYNTKGAFKQCL